MLYLVFKDSWDNTAKIIFGFASVNIAALVVFGVCCCRHINDVGIYVVQILAAILASISVLVIAAAEVNKYSCVSAFFLSEVAFCTVISKYLCYTLQSYFDNSTRQLQNCP